MIQLSLNQVLSALSNSLKSIDLRAAVVRTNTSENIVTAIRISARPVSEVKSRHETLIQNLGSDDAGCFNVLYDALEFGRLEEVLARLQGGTINFGPDSMVHLQDRILKENLRGYIQRNHLAVRHWQSVPASAFYSYLKFGLPKVREDLFNRLAQDVRRKFGAPSMGEVIDAFLELNNSEQDLGKFLMYLEMPAKITRV